MVSPDGDVREMWVRLVGAHFTNHLFIGDLLFPIHMYVSVVNNFKFVCNPDTLVAWSIGDFA